jgi:DegV family protein with EDD domain
MKPCCIITDSSAQFLQPSVEKKEFLRIIHFEIEIGGKLYSSDKGILTSQFPVIKDDRSIIRLKPLSKEKLSECFRKAASEYDQVIGIFLSSALSLTAGNAAVAALDSPARSRIHIIDSLTVANGLGFLVQKAIELVENGKNSKEIEANIRKLIPKIYTVIATLSSSYLHYSGFLDLPQAIALDLLGFYPIFTLEEGQLTPTQKVKTINSIASFLLEFLDEFSDLKSVSFAHNEINFSLETKLLRDACKEAHPDVNFVDLVTNPSVSALFGVRNLIFSVVEK